MTVTEFGWRDTIQAIRGARNCANPNFGFQRQLQEYENDGLEQVSHNPAGQYRPASETQTPFKWRFDGKPIMSQDYQGSSWALTVGRSDLGRRDNKIGRNYSIFCQFRSKLAITHTIAIKWKEKYDAVVVDCHHSLRLCG